MKYVRYKKNVYMENCFPKWGLQILIKTFRDIWMGAPLSSSAKRLPRFRAFVVWKKKTKFCIMRSPIAKVIPIGFSEIFKLSMWWTFFEMFFFGDIISCKNWIKFFVFNSATSGPRIMFVDCSRQILNRLMQ